MKERPILFNGAMVRALLAGTKTQTRRAVKPQPTGFVGGPGVTLCDSSPAPLVPMNDFAGTCGQEIICPYGQPGDRLWVRETFQRFTDDGETLYKADPAGLEAMNELRRDECIEARWRPAIHMPRWASRITLEITSVRVERLQDISEVDALAEGCTQNHNGYFWGGPHQTGGMKQMATALQAYQDLWESINGPGSWEANPWVWVLEFRRIDVEAA